MQGKIQQDKAANKNISLGSKGSFFDKNCIVPPETAQIGLALGSGLARGFAHIGVLRALTQRGIYPSLIAGTSMGALVGGCYATGRLDELEDWARSLNRRKIFSYLDFRVKTAGLIGGKRLNALLESHFGDTMIEQLDCRFAAVACDMVTGHEVWLQQGRMVDALRASFSLPGVFPPVMLNNRYLIDGALVNPVPVSTAQAMGSRLTIAVDVNADLMGKVAKPGNPYQTVTGFDVFDVHDVEAEDQRLFQNPFAKRTFRREQNSPSLFGVMVSALNIVQDRLTRSRLAGDPPDVHLKPNLGHIGLFEFEKAEELIQTGVDSVEYHMRDIEAAIGVLL